MIESAFSARLPLGLGALTHAHLVAMLLSAA